MCRAIVSLIAVVCLDYFFTPPLLQLEIVSPIDGVALVTYLVTSLIITRLASEAGLKARAAERKQESLARLYDTAWRLFPVEPQAVSVAGTLHIFREVLEVQAVCLFDGNPACPEYILTEPWIGYRFRDPPAAALSADGVIEPPL